MGRIQFINSPGQLTSQNLAFLLRGGGVQRSWRGGKEGGSEGEGGNEGEGGREGERKEGREGEISLPVTEYPSITVTC